MKCKSYWTTNSKQLSSYIIKGNTQAHTDGKSRMNVYFANALWIIGFHDIIKWSPFMYMSINFWKDAYRFACVLELLIPLKATKLYSKLAHDYKVYLPPSSSIQGCALYNEANHSTQCCRCSKIKYKNIASAGYKVFTIIHRVSLMWHSLLCCGSLEASWRAWACSSGEMSLRQCVRMSVHALFSSYHIAYTLT